MGACCNDGFENFDDVRFGILADSSSGVYQDWGGMEPIYAEEQIPYSSIVISEIMGYTPAQVTWRLTLCCRDSYNALLARIGTTGTLTILAGYQSLAGEQITRGNPGRVYEVLDHVRLRSMPVREHYPDGSREVEVVWERAFDPVSRKAVFTP